jgi:hypothetical protein
VSWFSDDLKDMLVHLWQSNPVLRLSISEIKNHPWYKGEVPTKEEFLEEMANREAILNDKGISEAEIPDTSEINPEEFESGASRGGGGEGEVELGIYSGKPKSRTAFASSFDATELYRMLLSYIDKNKDEFSFESLSNSYGFQLSKDDDEFDVEILQHEKKDVRCVVVMNVQGDGYTHFTSIKDFFGGASDKPMP